MLTLRELQSEFRDAGCSVLLVAGLATRSATLPLLGMIAVIQLVVYPGAWPEHLTWASILLFLLTRGAGTIAIDHVIGRGRRVAHSRRP